MAIKYSKKIRSYFEDEDEQNEKNSIETETLSKNEGSNLPEDNATLTTLPIKQPKEISLLSEMKLLDSNLLDSNLLDSNLLDSNLLDKLDRNQLVKRGGKHPNYNQIRELPLATDIKTVRKMSPHSKELSLAPNIKNQDNNVLNQSPAIDIKKLPSGLDSIKMDKQIPLPPDVKPMSLVPDVKPTSHIPDVKPMSLVPDVKPTDVKPTDVKPTDVKPTSLVSDVKPMSLVPDVKPVSLLPDVKPVSLLPDVKPISLLPDVKPISLVPDVKPISLVPDAKPISLVPDAKPMSLVPDAKPMSLVPDVKHANEPIIESLPLYESDNTEINKQVWGKSPTPSEKKVKIMPPLVDINMQKLNNNTTATAIPDATKVSLIKSQVLEDMEERSFSPLLEDRYLNSPFEEDTMSPLPHGKDTMSPLPHFNVAKKHMRGLSSYQTGGSIDSDTDILPHQHESNWSINTMTRPDSNFDSRVSTAANFTSQSRPNSVFPLSDNISLATLESYESEGYDD